MLLKLILIKKFNKAFSFVCFWVTVTLNSTSGLFKLIETETIKSIFVNWNEVEILNWNKFNLNYYLEITGHEGMDSVGHVIF